MNHNSHNNHSHEHQHESKGSDADVCMVENRDAEANSKLEPSIVASHVWETCRPGSRFVVKSPTVSVRRIQLMRAQLQFNPREWESEPSSEQVSEVTCAKPKPSCKCGLRPDSMRRSTSYSTTSSVSDVKHACPDECNEAEGTTEKEEEENDCCNY